VTGERLQRFLREIGRVQAAGFAHVSSHTILD
jgi:hypothetical protein